MSAGVGTVQDGYNMPADIANCDFYTNSGPALECTVRDVLSKVQGRPEPVSCVMSTACTMWHAGMDRH